MSASITLAGESQIALKQSQKKPLVISRFIFANVPGLDPVAPIDRAAGKPPAGQIVQVYDIPKENAGFVNPNQVVYSAQLGSDIGDWDFNWVGLEDEDGLLFAVSYVPLQQKRRNIPPQQVGNNVTRNFLVAFDGAMQLTGVKIDASTWQHDFTVRLAGIDERQRGSNIDVYGRSCFFGSGWQVEKVGSTYQLKSGGAYVGGMRMVIPTVLPIAPPNFPTTVWLDVALQRNLNDVVASWSVVFGPDRPDYTDSAGVRHFCVAIADLPNTSTIVDRRFVEPIDAALISYLAARNGDYPLLRARGTKKEDVGLENLPNAKSDDPTTNSSEILATTAALNKLKQQVGDSMTGMVASFAMVVAPPGWLKCNGAAVSRTAFAQLFAWLGTHYGAGDGSTTFNLPDMRGLFPRGWDDGRGVDAGRAFGVYQDMMLHAHAHTASAAAVGDHLHSAWTDAQGDHTHGAWTDAQGNHDHGFRFVDNGAGISIGASTQGGSIVNLELPYGQGADNRPYRTDYQGNHAHNVGIGAAGNHAHNIGVSGSGAHTHGVTVAAAGGTETRPKNLALFYCIKY